MTEFCAFLRYNSGSWLEVFDEGFFNTLVLKDDYNSYIVQMSFFDFLREVGVIVFALMSIALFIFAFLTAKRRINKLAGMILNVALGGLIFYLLFNIDNIADKVYDIYEVWINDAYMYKVELSVLGIVSLIVYYSLFKKITHERAVTEQT